MTAEEIRELTDEEILEAVRSAEDELFRLRFRAAYQELEDSSLLRERRRDVARMKTILRERELVGEATSDE